MTTISASTSTLSSLAALYASENGASTGADASGTDTTSTGTSASADGGLTSAQIANLESIVEGTSASSSNGLETLLGQSATTSGSTDLNSIIDAIQAQTSAKASGTTTGADSMTGTATTDQQKAAAVLQSVYAAQQANLFTLLG